MSEFDLNALIDDALGSSDEPDPHVIARRLLPKIPRVQRDLLLGELLGHKVRERIRFPHETSTAPAVHLCHETQRTSVASAGGRSKFARFAELRRSYAVPGQGWKLAPELTAADCDALAADYEDRAARNAAWAERFRGYAAAIRAAGVATLGDLDHDDLQDAA